MKCHTEELWMEIPSRRAIVSLHKEVEGLVKKSGVQEGIVLVNAMHITASVFINDNEPGLHADYERWLEELVPFDPGTDPAQGGYLHNRTGEDNADSMPITNVGSRSWCHSIPERTPLKVAIFITVPEKTTPTHITSGRLWAAKWWLPSPKASST